MVNERNKMNYSTIENVTAYLVEKTGSSLGYHQEKMSKAKQTELFGMYFGKGTICINGKDETICNRVKVCFGLDYDDRNVKAWRDL